MKIIDIFFLALRNQIYGGSENSAIQKECLQKEEKDLQNLYKLSKAHDLAHLVAQALDTNGLLDDSKVANQFRATRNLAIYRYEQINYDLQAICEVLEDAQIEHIPLKGSVIRKYYPEPWMRTSCDIDLLVHEEQVEQIKSIFQDKLGCEYKSSWYYEHSFYTPAGVHIELHSSLRAERAKEDAILNDVWKYAQPLDGKKYTKNLADEMYYFYHCSHMAKHFESGGCGIRPFMDIWILNHKLSFDKERRYELLKTGDLLSFAVAMEKLAEVWFSGAEHTELSKDLEQFILFGGVYGTVENRVAVQQTQKGGKFKYILSRIFLPYNQLKIVYPSVEKHKWLMPFYQIRRWFRLFRKGKVKKSLNEVNIAQKSDGQQTEKMQSMLRELGLNK